MYTISTLKNGLRVASCKMPKAHSIALAIWIGVGGRYENKQASGVSHFLEHLVFRGTKRRNYRQIKEAIEGRGGLLNGFTAEEFSCFYIKILAKHAPIAVDVLMDMVMNPLLKKQDIERERLVIFEEIKMYFDLPYHRAYDRLIEMLWPDQPLGRNLIGTFASLKKVGRKQLQVFKDSHYHCHNMLVSACGNTNHAQLLEYVRKNLRKHRRNGGSPQRSVYVKAAENQNASRVQFIYKDIEQTHLCLGVTAFDRFDARRHALALLHVILGANMSSRLFNEIREKKGYAYEIGTAIKRYNDTGAFIIHAGIVNEYAENALQLIIKQLRKICRILVTDNELQRAKEYYTGQLIMGLEEPSEHMMWMSEGIMVRGKPETAQSVIGKIERVDREEIMCVANRIFLKNHLNVSMVGPVDENVKRKLQAIIERF